MVTRPGIDSRRFPAVDVALDTRLVTRPQRTHRDRPPRLPDVVTPTCLKRDQRVAAVGQQSGGVGKLLLVKRRVVSRTLNPRPPHDVRRGTRRLTLPAPP